MRRNFEYQEPVVHYAENFYTKDSYQENEQKGNPYYKYDDKDDKISEKAPSRSSQRSLISYYNKKLAEYGTHVNPKVADVDSDDGEVHHNYHNYGKVYHEEIEYPKIYH